MPEKTQGKKIAVLENNLLSTYTMREALMLRLKDEGYQIFVITHTNKFVKIVEDQGIGVINVGSGNENPIHVIRYIYQLYKAVRRVKPDVCLTFSIRPAIWGNMITRWLSIPTITNITGTGPLFISESFVYKVARGMYRFVLRKTKKVFFQNKDDMNLFIKRKFVTEKVAERIPGSGVDHVKFKPIPSSRQNPHPFIFLFIGRLIRDKGIFEFIEAARIIKKELPAVVFRVLGPLWSQNLKTNIITQAELHGWISEEVIDYLGEKKDVRQSISDSDCIVLPSYREGTSNVLLEASSMEKPVITTDTPGCREIVEHGKTGFLCEVRSSADLVDKMKKMLALSDEQRAQMGKEGRIKIIKEYDKEIVINAYLKTIREYA